MVNFFDRPISAFSSRIKAVAAAVSPSLSSVSPRVKAISTASPKVKAIAAGGALAFLTAVAAPSAVAASHDGSSVSSQDVSLVADASGTPYANSAAPTSQQLHPVGNQGSQVGFTPSAEQMKNAQKIIQAGQSMGLPPQAWVIALATSMQETHLHNYGDLGGANDHDSLGLFQQRPSSGWGTASQVQDPTHAATAFYSALKQVPNWNKMPLTDAAQAVQVSAFGDRYAQWEAHAGDVVDAFYGQGPLADVAHKVM